MENLIVHSRATFGETVELYKKLLKKAEKDHRDGKFRSLDDYLLYRDNLVRQSERYKRQAKKVKSMAKIGKR